MYQLDDGCPFSNLVYRLTHIQRDSAHCEHPEWIEEFREHQRYWENLNKAPVDKTKVDQLPLPKGFSAEPFKSLCDVT